MARILPPEVMETLLARINSSGDVHPIAVPATGEPLAALPVSAPEDVRTAYAKAREAQPKWAARPPAERAKIFERLHDAILERRDEILDVVQMETGKARRHALEEVLDVAACSLYYARRGPGLLRPKRRQGIFPVATKTYELHHPRGTAAVISPWNYPLSLGVTDVVPALIAGNTVVHKPDTQTALSTLWTIDLLVRLGMPEEIWQVVTGDPAVVGDPIINEADYVAFTGSTRAGRTIAAKAAERLIGCSLELGGKNPMIVLDDAEPEKAARGAVRACFTNAGQLCISIERLYVADSIYDRFAEAFVREVESMKLSAGHDFDTDMGSLTSQRQLDAVGAHVEEAVANGAKVLAGGRPRPDIGPLFHEPTVLSGVTEDMTLCRTETFGPVVSLYPVRSTEEAIRMANDTDYGLNASVWTSNLARGRKVAARIKAGTVNVNEGYGSAYASYDAPMGGMKSSGVGRRHAAEGLLKYTESQTVASQQWLGFEPAFGLSQKDYADLMTNSLKIMKKFRLR